ncbi:glycerol kinase GlpK [bacterium]|nr:glycerol kinase GlpK [bacterium]
MKKYILSLDQGTTSSRAILFDLNGSIVAIAQKEFQQIFPQPGWVEHDADEIWQTQLETAINAIQSAGIKAADIAAIGITNQRETTVVWDRITGKSLYNAIVWQDRRTTEECNRLVKSGHSETVNKKTGLVIDSYFSGTKINWILNHVPGAHDMAVDGRLAFGTIDCWLIWKLTGGKLHITDVSNASRTMLFNIHSLRWDDELLRILDVHNSLLPKVRSSSEFYGETESSLFGASIPIAGIAGDQQAALFGQACFEKGSSKNTYGTGAFMMLNTGSKPISSKHNLITTIAWQISSEVRYALEGSAFMAGAVVQWLRDGLGIIRKSSEVEALALTVEDNGGVCLVPAFTGLGAPYWDSTARGIIAGLTRGTNTGHIARAALEAIACQSNDIFRCMVEDSGIAVRELQVDGGAAANNTLMQIQSDVMNIPLIRPQILESTARGAAFLAGLAVGFWKDKSEIANMCSIERRFKPQMSRVEVKILLKNWKRAVSKSKRWAV